MNRKSIIIVLIVLGIVLGGIGYFLMDQRNKSEQEEESGKIPIEQLVTVEYENPIIATIPFKDNETKWLNVSLTVGFALDSKKKAADNMKVQLEEKTGWVTHKVRTLLTAKDGDAVIEKTFEETFAQDILSMIQKELDTDAVIEIYFKEFLYSVKHI